MPTKSEHFHVPITLKGRQKSKEVVAMVDSGASTLFINKRWIKENGVATHKLQTPIPVYNIDGTLNQGGSITDMAVLTMKLGEHNEKAVFTVTDIGPEDVIIGIDWYEGIMVMDGCPDGCSARKVSTSNLTPKGDTEVRLTAPLRKKKVQKSTKRKFVKATTDIFLETDTLEESPEEQNHGPSSFDPERLAELQAKTPTTQIGGKGTQRRPVASRAASLIPEDSRLFALAGFTYSTELAMENAKAKPVKSLEEMVPEQYRRYMSVFSKAESERLPEHKLHDHAIELVPEAKGFHAKVYPLSKPEQEELDKFLAENLKKGYIQPSKSPMALPFFFVKKKDRALRPVQDYRRLNEMTIKNRYPLPLISELIDKLKGAKYFTKLDVRWGYNNVRIKEGDEHKAAFVTNRGLFEPTVMFFGLTNSPATFQNMMNDIFADFIAEGKVTVYLDDILIFSADLEEHRRIVMEVLRRLKENDLFLKPEKCEFEQDRTEYLGMIITHD